MTFPICERCNCTKCIHPCKGCGACDGPVTVCPARKLA